MMNDSGGRLVTPFGFATTASEVLDGIDLGGKTALVTGANSGIGFETARALAAAGAGVIAAARSRENADDASRRIAGETGSTQVAPLAVDLSDLDSVAEAASSVRAPLHILVNNAGVMAIPELTRTPQGHEMQFGVNYLGHFALTLSLHDALAAAGGARVVCLSSSAHLLGPVVFGDLDFRFRAYDPWAAYGGAKTACVLLAVEASRRWAADGIVANALNPGAIATGLQKHTGGLKTPVERRKTVGQGAATSVLAAASPLVKGIGGRYFEDVNEAPVRHESPGLFGTGVADYALDARYARLLWDVASEMMREGASLLRLPGAGRNCGSASGTRKVCLRGQHACSPNTGDRQALINFESPGDRRGTVRDVSKGEHVAAAMPGSTEVRRPDLSSVREFAAGWTGTADVLVNNAGIMGVARGTDR